VQDLGKKVILAGGLNPENVAVAVAAVRPLMVDVASGVEASPGKKDRLKVEMFISRAKSANPGA
jgi:phosphoribosylanthranilate isomerase